MSMACDGWEIEKATLKEKEVTLSNMQLHCFVPAEWEVL